MFSSLSPRMLPGSAPAFVRLSRQRTRHTRLSVVRACPPTICISCLSSLATSSANSTKSEEQDTPRSQQPGLSKDSPARFNEIGIQQLSEHMHAQLFAGEKSTPDPELVELAREHLRLHELEGKSTDKSPPVSFDLPLLQGNSLDAHFHRLGLYCSEPWKTLADQLARSSPPPRPKKWIRQSGWTKYYHDGTPPEKVDAPDADILCFDVETLWKISNYAVMACASSPQAWYAWLSPWLLKETEDDRQLIPLGDPSIPRVIVGHNIGYDRARILEEYSLNQSQNCFLDTMSLHVSVNGMCSQQRPTWLKHQKHREVRDQILSQSSSVDLAALMNHDALRDEEELWVERSSINSLREVAKFHLNVSIDKSVRNDFSELDRDGVLDKLDTLLDYCAADVTTTQRVFSIVFPLYLEGCPHPVSFAALRHLSNTILPVDRTWNEYIERSEKVYQELTKGVWERLAALVDKALEIKDEPEKWRNDPWLMQLDWTQHPIRMVKGKKKTDPPRPAKRQKLPGMPEWYRQLFPKLNGPMNLSVRTRISPLLLRLSWDGNPLFWSDKYGWTYRVPHRLQAKYTAQQAIFCDMSDEKIEMLQDHSEYVYFKVPHKDGPAARCANPLAKSYQPYFESGVLSSEFDLAQEALKMNASCSYWISARDRITSQMVVFNEDLKSSAPVPGDKNQGFILPQIIPMGTITRRAVEKTWLTASNAKANRVGSELKAMVKAPPGYCFVGADVDSEELWIASLVGDSSFKLHGGNALGFMTLEGTKSAGTDMHSRTASILGITRNNAKVFNYGRIYGAGVRFAATLLRQFNHNLSEDEAAGTATKLYASTKGTKTNRKILSSRPFWRGGTESYVFNKLEEFAEQERPRTPVLGASITEALMRRYINKGSYMTSRINWAIQSSGVDYLHLLLVGTDYLARKFAINMRVAITVHDEIRYLVKEEDKYRAALALQVANLWTRAMFAEQMGIRDLPQSCAFFSAVDIDRVLRKEVDLPCVTPSHPTSIPPGESIDIRALLAKGEQAYLDPQINPELTVDHLPYTPRVPVMEAMKKTDATVNTSPINFLRAQMIQDDAELGALIRKTLAEIPRTKTNKYLLKGNKDLRTDKYHMPFYGPSSSPKPALLPKQNDDYQHGREVRSSKAVARAYHKSPITSMLTRGEEFEDWVNYRHHVPPH